MKAKVLTGSKSEIAETLARIEGDVREAIVFVEEPSDSVTQPPTDDLFAEMERYTVKVGGADYSRQSICRPMAGE
jgi:hypothetical protein